MRRHLTLVSLGIGLSLTACGEPKAYCHNSHLSGGLPPELGQLSKLSLLDLDSNDLGGPIPPEYGNLRNLEGLKLRNNRLSGALPPEPRQSDPSPGLVAQHQRLLRRRADRMVRMTSLRIFAANSNPNLGPLPPYLASLPPDGYSSLANPNIP